MDWKLIALMLGFGVATFCWGYIAGRLHQRAIIAKVIRGNI